MGIGRDELMISQRGADLPCCRSGLQLIPAEFATCAMYDHPEPGDWSMQSDQSFSLDIVNLEECHMDETGRFLQLGAGSHSSLTANDGFFNTNAPYQPGCLPNGEHPPSSL
ncbi:hypothetical protein PGTUg99_022150 [Puccinia graminis f. sp. tritici]|uniref:Uncharacterized protein n=1 Tax=Puccinia graminis f. sp. tritici TaxID=56615 RepID=A0A5B0REH8_PUCGR|nr:hypothetical protein PGTUg99_022150 [Puccinia graminis f. sp. tritici]